MGAQREEEWEPLPAHYSVRSQNFWSAHNNQSCTMADTMSAKAEET